jgi:polysaccharide export outer membrane protein
MVSRRSHPINALACLIILATAWSSAEPARSQKHGPASDQASGTKSSQPTPTLAHRPRYQIEPGDVIDLGFPLSPDFNQTLTVAPDGFVSLRGAGDLSVANMTLPQLRIALVGAYSKILHNPIVNVDLKDFQKSYFIVGGQVAHPGKYDLRENVSAAQALAIAGGTVQGSKSSQVLLFRRQPGGSMVEVRKLNMKSMMKKGNLSEDVYLQPGDMLYVPKSAFANIERFLPSSELGVYAPGIP